MSRHPITGTEPGLDAAWLARLKRSIDKPPAMPRAALCLAACGADPSVATIGSIDPALAARLAAWGQPLRVAGAAWWIDTPGAAAVDETLASIAGTLRQLGELPGWRGELLAVRSAAGVRIGAIERSAVRALGIASHAVHLIVLDERGRIWVQLRAHDKANDPGCWDTTVGGLVSDGETAEICLWRESWEEAGLRAAELRGLAPVGNVTVRRPTPEGYMVEDIEVFEATLPGGGVPHNQDGEVERFECWHAGQLLARLQADAFTLEASTILAQWLGPHAAALASRRAG